MSPAVSQPTTRAELTDILERANAARTPVRVTSDAGPTFKPGIAPELKLGPAHILLSLGRMDTRLEHCAGDLTATIPAGITLADANRVLARGGQWLPLDPPGADRQTIGSIVATNASGPRRHRFGTSRDLIIGVEMALADGRMAKAGGRVVKNVAGYDLARLMCGSLGSLAIIVNATFKLSPIAPASTTVVVEAGNVDVLAAAVDAISGSPLTPTTLEIDGPPWRLFVRFDTTPLAAGRQAEQTVAIASKHGASARIVSGDDETRVWEQHEADTWGTRGTLVKCVILPATLATFLRLIERTCDRHAPLAWSLGGRAALGVLSLRLGDRADAHAALVAELRNGVIEIDGRVEVQERADGAADIRESVDLGDARPLMEALKHRFDPHGILNPGAGPAGL